MKKLTTDEIQRFRHAPEALSDVHRVPLCGVLDNVRSLYNVGSIFRTSDAVMVRELVLTGYTPRPPRREIDKTALGSTKTVPWRYVPDVTDALSLLRSEGWSICAVEVTDRSTSIYEFDDLPTEPLVLVFGNEITGISDRALPLCDRSIEIPMYGTKHSLNVAVAYGIAVYEIARRMRSGNPR